MREEIYMEIKIYKKEDGVGVFSISGEEYEFNYDNFDKLIEDVYSNDDTISYDTADDMKDYEMLIKGIVDGSRTEDYRNAVQKAKEAEQKLIEKEQQA